MTYKETQQNDILDEYRLDDQIGFILRLASQRYSGIFQKHAKFDLTATQFATLVRISELTSCSQNKLGRLTGMDAATIKGVVGRLAKREFVSVVPDTRDKRSKIITLTENGYAIINDLIEVGQRITTETLAPLEKGEQQMLMDLLRRLT